MKAWLLREELPRWAGGYIRCPEDPLQIQDWFWAFSTWLDCRPLRSGAIQDSPAELNFKVSETLLLLKSPATCLLALHSGQTEGPQCPCVRLLPKLVCTERAREGVLTCFVQAPSF